MDAHHVFLGILLATTLVYVVRATEGACFQFKGEGRVKFTYGHEYAQHAHFSLKFKTSANAGVIYYAGTYNRQRVFDYEGLYIHDGYLHYFLYNAGQYSMGPSSGFYGKSKVTVNDGRWHTAAFTRNREMEILHEDGTSTMEHVTSLVLDGVTQARDTRHKAGVDIFQPAYLGRDPYESDRNAPFPGFKGSIKEFKDMMSGQFLADGTIEGDVTHCIDVPDAQ